MQKALKLSLILVFWGVTALAYGQEGLDFSEALKRVYKRHPLLKAFAEKESSALLRALQAARWENPELSVSFEDVFGSGPYSGTRSAETTIEIAQKIPLFGKKARAKEALEAEKEVLSSLEEETRLSLFRETALAFTRALYAQEKVRLLRELTDLSRRLVEVSRAKYEAGKIPETEKIRAEIVASRTETQLAVAQLELEKSLANLGRLWGGPSPKKVAGDIYRRAQVPVSSFSIKRHPRLKIFEARLLRLNKERALARVEKRPDITLSAGWRFYEESDSRAYVFGLSLPLPLWDRNQEKVAALSREEGALREEMRAEEWKLLQNWERTRKALEQTYHEIETLEERLLPRARDLYRRNLEAYRLGKREFLRVLDAQRTLFELRLGRLESYRRYHELRAKAFYLLARKPNAFF